MSFRRGFGIPLPCGDDETLVLGGAEAMSDYFFKCFSHRLILRSRNNIQTNNPARIIARTTITAKRVGSIGIM